MTWEPAGGSYLEAGRINVRSGAALGFNPTDFFKTRTLVGQSSLDPSVIRQNRLGTLMVRAQTLWAWGSASVAYAPMVAQPSPITESNPVGVDPRFDATNAAHRVLCTLNLEMLDLSPQLLGYFELHRSKLGANVTRSIGDAVVAYAEWAAGPEQDLIARAAAFGRQTGTLPGAAPTHPRRTRAPRCATTWPPASRGPSPPPSPSTSSTTSTRLVSRARTGKLVRPRLGAWRAGAPDGRPRVRARLRQRPAGALVAAPGVRPRLVTASLHPGSRAERIRLRRPARRLGPEPALGQLLSVGRLDGVGVCLRQLRGRTNRAGELSAARERDPAAHAVSLRARFTPPRPARAPTAGSAPSRSRRT